MTKHTNPRSGDHEFIIGFTDTMRDLRHRRGLEFVVAVVDGGQRGVIGMQFAALVKQENGDGEPIALYSATWPNSMVMSFPAFLFRGANALARMVDQWEEEQLDRALRAVEEASG